MPNRLQLSWSVVWSSNLITSSELDTSSNLDVSCGYSSHGAGESRTMSSIVVETYQTVTLI